RFVDKCEAFGGAVLLHARDAEVQFQSGAFARRQCGAVQRFFDNRFHILGAFLGDEGGAQRLACLHEIGLEAQRFAILRLGLFEILFRRESQSKVETDAGVGGREWECVLQYLNSFVGAARAAQKLGQMKIGFRLSGFDADGVLIKVDSLLYAALGAADMAEEEEYGGIFGIGGSCLLQQGFAARQIVARKGGGGLLQERLEVRQKKTAKLVT